MRKLLLLPLHIIFAILVTTTTCLLGHAHAQDDDHRNEFLVAHNEARSQVGVAPLVWNETLATFASNKLKNACNDESKFYSGISPYGENKAAGYEALSSYVAVGAWVGEKGDYNHETNTCAKGKDCKPYTQVVWRNTKSIGCATVVCGLGWPFVVCEYYPPGNIKGQSPY